MRVSPLELMLTLDLDFCLITDGVLPETFSKYSIATVGIGNLITSRETAAQIRGVLLQI